VSFKTLFFIVDGLCGRFFCFVDERVNSVNVRPFFASTRNRNQDPTFAAWFWTSKVTCLHWRQILEEV
jgi:hypothetical protein